MNAEHGFNLKMRWITFEFLSYMGGCTLDKNPLPALISTSHSIFDETFDKERGLLKTVSI